MNQNRFFPISDIAAVQSWEDHAAFQWVCAMGDVAIVDEYGIPGFQWLHDCFQWGPTEWPFRWSDLLSVKQIDCGVFAAITQFLLAERGIDCSRAQWIESVCKSQTASWERQWIEAGLDPANWILDSEHVYHEIVVLQIEGETMFFDTTENRIVNPAFPEKKISHIRLCSRLKEDAEWRGTTLPPGEWVTLNTSCARW